MFNLVETGSQKRGTIIRCIKLTGHNVLADYTLLCDEFPRSDADDSNTRFSRTGKLQNLLKMGYITTQEISGVISKHCPSVSDKERGKN